MERIPDMTITADWDIMHQLKKQQIFWHAQWAYKNLNPLKVFKYSYVYARIKTGARLPHARGTLLTRSASHQ